MRLGLGIHLGGKRTAALAGLRFARSANAPTGGGASAVPAGSDPLWASTNGTAWTRIEASFADFPITLSTAANLTVTGRVVEKTAGGDTYTNAISYSSERYTGTKRFRCRLLAVAQCLLGDENLHVYTGSSGTSIQIAGAVGSGTLGAAAVNDILDLFIDPDGTHVLYKNDNPTALFSGADSSAMTPATNPRLGLFMFAQGSKIEVLGWGPSGAAAPVKVGQTSADGTTWRAPTVGDTHLRVSNDAGFTAPSVVVS